MEFFNKVFLKNNKYFLFNIIFEVLCMALRERTHRAVRPHRSKNPYNPKKSKGKSYNGSAEEYLGLNKNKNYNKNIDPLDEKIKAKKKLLRELVNAQRVRYRNRKKKGKILQTRIFKIQR